MLLGIALVLVSALGVVWLVGSVQRTQEVYAASVDLAVGDEISPEDLQVVHVRLDTAAEHYLAPEPGLEPGSRVLSGVTAGELVPARSVGHPDGTGRRPIAVEIEGSLPAGVERGGRVDVYATPTGSAASGERPSSRLVLGAAEVTEVSQDEEQLASAARTVVQVLVEPDDVPALLAARGAGDRIDVVALPPGSAR